MSTSVPAIQWTAQGVVLPTEAAILAGVQSDIDTAFGGGVNPGLSTPQGQIASSDTAIIADKNSAIAYVVNQLDPQYAEGRFQDAIGRYYFMTRKAANSTVVIATIGGLPGTYIPAGVLALDTNQNVYQLLGSVTIGSEGTIPAEFANVATGPIACAAGALSQRTILEQYDYDTEEERERKAEEAALLDNDKTKGQVLPLFDPSHGTEPINTPDGGGRPAGQKDGTPRAALNGHSTEE